MIDALIKRVSVTYKCYEMYAHRGKTCNGSCFEIDQEMDAILSTLFTEFVESSLNQYNNADISYFCESAFSRC
jgi:hypothetical protein